MDMERKNPRSHHGIDRKCIPGGIANQIQGGKPCPTSHSNRNRMERKRRPTRRNRDDEPHHERTEEIRLPFALLHRPTQRRIDGTVGTKKNALHAFTVLRSTHTCDRGTNLSMRGIHAAYTESLEGNENVHGRIQQHLANKDTTVPQLASTIRAIERIQQQEINKTPSHEQGVARLSRAIGASHLHSTASTLQTSHKAAPSHLLLRPRSSAISRTC